MSRAPWSRRVAGKMEQLENVSAEAEKFRAAAIARSSDCIWNSLIDPARSLSHNHDAIAHVNGFVYVVRNKKYCRATCLPQSQDFILHAHASKSVQRAERLVE